MKQNKRFISYALGVSLLICGYSIVTHVTNHKTGVCFASEQAQNQSNIMHMVEIVKNDTMAKSELFLSDFIKTLIPFDNSLEIEYAHSQKLEELAQISAADLAEKISILLNRQGIEIDCDLLTCRIIEMEIFEAFKRFLEMDPKTSPYKWEDIRIQLSNALEGMRTISGSFVNPIYIKLYNDLQTLKGKPWILTLALKLRPYLGYLPQSIQRRCGPSLAQYIK